MVFWFDCYEVIIICNIDNIVIIKKCIENIWQRAEMNLFGKPHYSLFVHNP